MYRTLILFSLIFFSSFGVSQQTICLNMIVKNEAAIIRRCLDSVKEIIDYWVIVDTGSIDGTQEIIKEHMKEIPGELHERPWINWGETRSEAFEAAKGKGDYILFMDADDILEFDEGFSMPELTEDLYSMWRGTQSFSYLKPQIVKGNLPWKWIGVTHEYLGCDSETTSAIFEGVRYVSIDDGATRRDPEKYWKNVRLLEEGLKKEPNHSRYMFYLAESYRDAGERAKALEWFQKRVKMGGWEEEIYWSKLQIGQMLRALELPNAIVIEGFKDAFQFRPHRAEAPYFLAELYNSMGEYAKAYEILKIRECIPKPAEKDSLFNMDWIEDYGLLFQLSICSYYVEQYQESLDVCNQLLANAALPEEWRKIAESNRMFPLEKLQSFPNVQRTVDKGSQESLLPRSKKTDRNAGS
ncbi:MAG: glycosyltransferase [Chlamydiales bacterium]